MCTLNAVQNYRKFNPPPFEKIFNYKNQFNSDSFSWSYAFFSIIFTILCWFWKHWLLIVDFTSILLSVLQRSASKSWDNVRLVSVWYIGDNSLVHLQPPPPPPRVVASPSFTSILLIKVTGRYRRLPPYIVCSSVKKTVLDTHCLPWCDMWKP